MVGELARGRRSAGIETGAWLALGLTSVIVWLLSLRVLGFAPAVPGSDAWNYLAAGERLNAGHPLYALTTGDRPILLAPPYWTVPLLSPPPIAVIWRPLALLGDVSMTIWAGAGLVVTVATAGWLLLRGGVIVAAIVACFAIALAEQSVAGNVNAFLFGLFVLVWQLRERPAVVGAAVGVAIAIKLTPALLLIWLATSRRWRSLWTAVLVLGAAVLVSIAGAGIQNHLDWLASVPASIPVPSSLAGMTGLSASAIEIAIAVVVLLIGFLGKERLTFSAAMVAIPLASPALYLGTLAIAAAAAAPWISPASTIVGRARHRFPL